MAVSKRLRHEIFRRDNHTCQSCGAKAPDVKLEPDHVIPVALGGSDHPSNLQTLCTDCNAGKSATPPDATVVAKVTGDAARWAKAMESAAGNLLGARQARDEARAAFDAKWLSWSEGRPPLPRPQGWEASVDGLIKAGLPPEALLDCVDIAMSRRHVRAGDVFKYMCGVAWKEVRRLQKEAGALVHAPEAVPDTPDEVANLWEEAITDLYDTLTPDEQQRHEISSERLLSLEIDEDDRYPVASAFDCVLSDLRSDLGSVGDCLVRLLEALPEGVGRQAMKRAWTDMYASLGNLDLITRHRFAEWATYEALEMLDVRERKQYYDALPVDQRNAWLAYAEVVQNERPRGANYMPWADFAEEDRAVHAASHAYEASRNRTVRWMCQATGEVIDNCMGPARFLVLVNEAECCTGSDLSDHGHPLCEDHVAKLVEGDYRSPSGELRTIRDFREFTVPSEEEPPF